MTTPASSFKTLAENMRFDTMVNLMRIGTRPDAEHGVTYELPNVNPKDLRDLMPKRGVIRLHELCALALPHILRVQQYRDEARNARAEAKECREKMASFMDELQRLRISAYRPQTELEDYDDEY